VADVRIVMAVLIDDDLRPLLPRSDEVKSTTLVIVVDSIDVKTFFNVFIDKNIGK